MKIQRLDLDLFPSRFFVCYAYDMNTRVYVDGQSFLYKASGTEVVYVGFNNKTTKAIVVSADLTEIIRDQEIIEAFDRLNPPGLPL